MFLISNRPLKDRLQNNIEIMNEIFILIMTYSLPFFTMFMTDIYIRNTMGLYLIAGIGLNVITNMTIMVVLTVKELIK